MKLLLIALFTACAFPAVARIGETWEQCAARYGKPRMFDKDTGSYVYNMDGRLLTCHFYEGICDRITYMYTFQDASGRVNYLELSDGEIEFLLTKVGTSEKWIRQPDDAGAHHWQTEHGTLHAFYVVKDRALGVFTHAALAREQAKNKAK